MSKDMKFIKDVSDLQGKKVLMRIDVNEPITAEGVPTDFFRIERATTTLKYLTQRGAKVILMSHLGRPDGKYVAGLSLKFLTKELAVRSGVDIEQMSDIVGENVINAVNNLADGKAVMLENVRFDAREEENNEHFAYELAQLGEIYVNDAFSVSHRAHASVHGVTKFLPSYAGLILEEEINTLNKVLDNPESPAVAIIGGAKIETKLPVIETLAKSFDTVLVGGKIALEYIDQFGQAKQPNVVLAQDFTDNKFDIGPKTIAQFSQIVKEAKTVIWNGPMGKFEEEEYAKGTKELLGALLENQEAFVIVGGGETVDAVRQANAEDKIDFVSTGGGAMLEYIADRNLPGIAVLES
jgi:phosphoglycerate kinase